MWETEMVLFLRFLIDDFDTPQTNTDAKLTQLITVAARTADSEIDFIQDYVISIANSTISPDPCDPATKDDDFVTLVCLKAACIMTRGNLNTSGFRGVKIVDSVTQVDTTSGLGNFIKASESFCQDYEEAKWQYIAGKAMVGRAILSVFRVGYNGNGHFYGPRRDY